MVPSTNKGDYKKLASFFIAGEINSRGDDGLQNGRKSLPWELIAQIYKKLQKLSTKDTKLTINKWTNEMNR